MVVTHDRILHSDVSDVIDREAVLDRVGGDLELLREITEIFQGEYPELLVSIREAVAAEDAKKLEIAAHTLKGAVSNFGAAEATASAYQLESMGRSGNFAGASEALDRLEKAFKALEPALAGLLEENA